MGTTPLYNLPFPEAGESPNGPVQVEALAVGVEGELDRIDGLVATNDGLLDEFMPSGLAAAPVETASESSYPFGMSTREAITGLGYPTNGVLVTYRYATSSRVVQILTSSSSGATATKQFVRSRGTGPAWTPWVETTAAPLPSEQATSEDVLNNITAESFNAGAVFCGTSFVAPITGRVTVTVTVQMAQNVPGSYGILGYEIREGGTVGVGAVFSAAHNFRSVSTSRNAVNSTNSARIGAAFRYLHGGLTPGATYNARTMHRNQGVGSLDIVWRHILVEPAS